MSRVAIIYHESAGMLPCLPSQPTGCLAAGLAALIPRYRRSLVIVGICWTMPAQLVLLAFLVKMAPVSATAAPWLLRTRAYAVPQPRRLEFMNLAAPSLQQASVTRRTVMASPSVVRASLRMGSTTLHVAWEIPMCPVPRGLLPTANR